MRRQGLLLRKEIKDNLTRQGMQKQLEKQLVGFVSFMEACEVCASNVTCLGLLHGASAYYRADGHFLK